MTRDTLTETQTAKGKEKKNQKIVVITVLELILIKTDFNDYEEFGRVSA